MGVVPERNMEIIYNKLIWIRIIWKWLSLFSKNTWLLSGLYPAQ
jgi:hypothetical protein